MVERFCSSYFFLIFSPLISHLSFLSPHFSLPISHFLTTDSLLPITNLTLLIFYYQLLTTDYRLYSDLLPLIPHSSLLISHSSLHISHLLLPTTYYQLPTRQDISYLLFLPRHLSRFIGRGRGFFSFPLNIHRKQIINPFPRFACQIYFSTDGMKAVLKIK